MIRLQEIIYEFNINLYNLLKINKNASAQEIELAFRKQAKFYDPEITGNNNNLQFYEELLLAYKTLINPESKSEYDEYLQSVGSNMHKEKGETYIDPEEAERR